MHPHVVKTVYDRELAGLRIPITHCSERDCLDLFRADLATSTNRVTILSPFLSQNRAIYYYPVFRSLTTRQVVIHVYTRPRQEQPASLREPYWVGKTGMSDIIARCKKALEEHYGARFAGMVLYGSMARGEARSTSDIDLLVLLKEPFDYFQELRTITELLYPFQLASDRLVSAKPAAVEEYERGSLQLYRNAPVKASVYES